MTRLLSASGPTAGTALTASTALLGVRLLDEDFRLRLKEVWEGVIEGIAGMVREAQAEGALDAKAESGEIARSFFGQIQGAHIIARSTLDQGALELDCRRAVENLPWADKGDKKH